MKTLVIKLARVKERCYRERRTQKINNVPPQKKT